MPRNFDQTEAPKAAIISCGYIAELFTKNLVDLQLA